MATINPQTDMVVPVHGEMYHVRIVPGPLACRGKTTAARIQHPSKLIEIDEIIPPDDRWRVAALAVASACAPKLKPVRVIGSVD